MEESEASVTFLVVTSPQDSISAAVSGEEAVAQTRISRMKSEDLGHKDGALKWEVSPERTMSLLPPFGAIQQLGHLPTPQSPGDLANYLSGPVESPSSLEHPRPGHIHSFSSQRSRSTSASSPQTPHRDRPTSALKKPPVFSVPKVLKDSSRPDEIEYARLPASQVATPSPEVSRIRRASLPSTVSDTETMLATLQPGRRRSALCPEEGIEPIVITVSSSHPYTAPTPLAPAPIISPANSSHSTTYHPSPEFEPDETESSRVYDFPYSMAALVSQHRVEAGVHDHGYYDHDDPFIDSNGEGRGEALTRERYPSPPPKMHQQRYAAHAKTSPLQNVKAGKSYPLENSIAKLVMSEAPSHGSPVKIEADDRHYAISMGPLVSLTTGEGTPSRTPMSPRTPPRVSSGRASASEPHSLTLDKPVFRTSPPLSGGEIERIRQRQAMEEDTRVAESEKRRPDYLMRIKRVRDIADEEVAEKEREGAISGLGVTVSPFRGRRLKLYQPVAVASNVVALEESVTETHEVAEPTTPPPIQTVLTGSIPPGHPTVPSMSLRAIDWHTPRRGRSSLVAWTEEDERRKQKRLQAFAALKPSGKGCRLKPAEVVGKGRVIIDVTSEESRKLVEDGVLQLLETPETDPVEDAELSLASGHGAKWPDKEYPWSVQERQRDEYEEAWRRQRLTWIERFLDRESESEDEENECVAGPSTWNQTFDSSSTTRAQRGHGKSISINATPNSKRSGNVRQVTFIAANTDAREVLLSKKHVRTVAERLRKRRIAEEEEGVVMCICQGADDGRPMVRCDECRTWYHLICMDIHDESELGDEWYCWKCLPSAEDPLPAPPTEPTFAPAMPDSPPRAGVGDQPLYLSTLQPSPMPTTPIAHRRDGSPTRRSRLPHSLGDPGDPVRGGPSTPYHSRPTDSRLFLTPKLYEEYGSDEHAPFDPTSTPSRGLKFPNTVPVTPRRLHSWTPAPPLSWTTPSGPPRTPHFSSQGGSSSNRSLAYSLSTIEDSIGPLTSPWPADDSPTRKPHRGTDSTWPQPTSRRVLDSPLTMRGVDHRPFPPGIDDSPTPGHLHKGKDNELASCAGHSPHRD